MHSIISQQIIGLTVSRLYLPFHMRITWGTSRRIPGRHKATYPTVRAGTLVGHGIVDRMSHALRWPSQFSVRAFLVRGIDLNATDDQLQFPLLYAAGRDGIAQKTLTEEERNLHLLLDTILEEIHGPSYDRRPPSRCLCPTWAIRITWTARGCKDL
jgi:hypothetical protein